MFDALTHDGVIVALCHVNPASSDCGTGWPTYLACKNSWRFHQYIRLVDRAGPPILSLSPPLIILVEGIPYVFAHFPSLTTTPSLRQVFTRLSRPTLQFILWGGIYTMCATFSTQRCGLAC